MPWRQQAQDTVLQGWQLLASGPGAGKAGSAAVVVVVAALWDAATSLVVAILLLFWVADMVSGVLRSIDRDGLDGFQWTRFWEGFRKLLSAGVVLAIAVGADLLLWEAGVRVPVVFVAVGGVLTWGFFWSALQNLDHFHPGVRGAVERALRSEQAKSRERERR